MYEFTHRGLWFKWSALDRASKRWAAASLSAALIAAIPIGLAGGEVGYGVGYRLGIFMAGGVARVPPMREPLLPFTPMVAWVLVALLAISALTWWRFSLRQDEMFNRVQNWALGMSGGWTAALLSAWAILSLSGATPPVSPLALLAIFYLAVIGFWMVAVRRWL